VARRQLGVYRQSLLKQAFEGHLTAKWRTQNPAKVSAPAVPAVTTDKELGTLDTLPDGWVWTLLSNVGELGRGKSKHRPRNDAKLFGGSYPFIQTGEVKAASKTVKTYTETYSEFGLAQSKLWPKGTLCITIAANIAETAFLVQCL
jgi:type I restriction enzyme S subunit